MEKIVAVSGCFDPIHPGHILYFNLARCWGHKLFVLLDSDDYVSSKHPVLLPQEERANIIREIRGVDAVLLNKSGNDVSPLLEAVRPATYVVGEKQNPDGSFSFPEYETCRRLRIKIVSVWENMLGCRRSSSAILQSFTGRLLATDTQGEKQ